MLALCNGAMAGAEMNLEIKHAMGGRGGLNILPLGSEKRFGATVPQCSTTRCAWEAT